MIGDGIGGEFAFNSGGMLVSPTAGPGLEWKLARDSESTSNLVSSRKKLPQTEASRNRYAKDSKSRKTKGATSSIALESDRKLFLPDSIGNLPTSTKQLSTLNSYIPLRGAPNRGNFSQEKKHHNKLLQQVLRSSAASTLRNNNNATSQFNGGPYVDKR